jgi:hypothetical protein
VLTAGEPIALIPVDASTLRPAKSIASLRVQLYSLSGHKLLDQTIKDASALTLSGLGELANGIYLYVVTAQGMDGKNVRTQVKKLLIER